jgi:hypothetical protein
MVSMPLAGKHQEAERKFVTILPVSCSNQVNLSMAMTAKLKGLLMTNYRKLTNVLRTEIGAVVVAAFLLAGSAGNAEPLDNWNTRNSGVTNVLNAVGYGNGVYVVVGNEGTLLSSTNGVNWTKRSSGTTAALNSIVYANNLFVVVGENGTALSSVNGTLWGRRTSGTTEFLYDVTYGGGKFVAVSDTGTVVISTNGTTWTLKNWITPGCYGVAYGNGKFVSVGATYDCPSFFCYYNVATYYSTDGTTWSAVVRPGLPLAVSDVAFGNGVFVAVGDGGTVLLSSSGTAWTQPLTGSSDFLWNVAFAHNTFVVVGGVQGTILTSSDGQSWTPRNSGTGNGLFNVGYGNGTFVAVGQYGTILQSDAVAPLATRLQLTASGSGLQFSWPTAAGAYSLEETDDLNNPAWVASPNQFPTVVGDQTVVNLTTPTGNKFFRLTAAP